MKKNIFEKKSEFKCDRILKEDRHRLKERVVFFSNSEHCSKITSEGCCLVPEKASDHEEADTKLVALVNSADVNTGESFMVMLPSYRHTCLILATPI